MAIVDPRRTVTSMSRAEKNVRFGVARGLTQIAKQAAKLVNDSMEQRFDRPTPFTKRSAAFTPATRERLRSEVFIKDIQAGYLLLEETGGTRRGLAGSPINLPVNQRTNVYGNIPRRAIARERAKPTRFVATRGDPKTAHLAPGIYRRYKRRGRAPKLLIAFERIARYRPRLRFQDTVRRFVMQQGPAIVAQSLANALRTARRGP